MLDETTKGQFADGGALTRLVVGDVLGGEPQEVAVLS